MKNSVAALAWIANELTRLGIPFAAFKTNLVPFVLGITVPVMERSALIAYKRLAGRELDLIDVLELEQGYKK